MATNNLCVGFVIGIQDSESNALYSCVTRRRKNTYIEHYLSFKGIADIHLL
jgi:hypothetical protein